MSEHFAMPARGRPSRSALSARLDEQVSQLWNHLGGLPSPAEEEDIWRNIWFEDAHHSTAIEGNTLVLKQVEALLAQGRAIGNRELREYNEVKGYADAADWVYRQAMSPHATSDRAVLTLTEIRHVHRLVMTPVWDVAPHPDATDRETPGNFREHEIRSFPGGMKPVSRALVSPELDTWIADVNSLVGRTQGFPDELAHAHARFERVHPFLDGNGRTGRLLLNLILVRHGYPPAVIPKRQRREYLRALQRADNGEPGQLGELIARAVLENLYRFVIPAVAGPAKLVPLAALATAELGTDALRAAAIRGRLQASKGPDGQWRSSRAWVERYAAERYRR